MHRSNRTKSTSSELQAERQTKANATDTKDTKDTKPEQTNRETQDELQWIVAQRLLSALTIPGFS